ncbi:hypothetical protein [Salinispora arenicola]|uniref:hypothetical protein n=1 Tax=Salinispora arenicola TaxID=168697 RepID=UPI0016ACB485|nr:hypothetical protein [Salinispora arenicola]NIL56242.1 hypothetical protein [Salinispora arenicola]NIL62127.1 hypothetical protein [Salinispora arenicola]
MSYEIFDPYADLPDGVNAEKWLEQQGWSEFLGVGGEDSDLHIRSFRRTFDGRDEFLVDVWDVNQGSPYVKVDNFGDLMDLLARWAPAIQAAALVQAVDNLRSPALDMDGVAEVVGAKVAFGASDVLPALRRDRQEQAAYRRQVAEQRKAAREAASRPSS